MQSLDRTTVARTERPVTVLQFGGGNFLRGFVDWMVQRANDAGVMDAGVAVVHATARQDPAFELLRRQDGLFHVLLEGVRNGDAVRDVTRVECVQTVVDAHREPARYRDVYLDPALRVIVSNTTEAGIVHVEGDDLTAAPPASFPAKVTALLHDRFRHFDGDLDAGLAVVPCELIEDNGSTLRRLVLRHARAAGLGSEFLEWVEAACSFHDTLVDRIVPGLPRGDLESVQRELGFADRVVVRAELFHLWAIAGDERLRAVLPFDRAGLNVLFLDDIRPLRAQKVRVLNGAHTALGAVGLQLGFAEVREAYEDVEVRTYVDRLVGEEVLPTIDGDAAQLQASAAGTLERFTNPFLRHRLSDIALNAVPKWRARNLPVLVDRIRTGDPAPMTTFSLAAVLRLQAGVAKIDGFEPADDADTLRLLADAYPPDDPAPWVRSAVDRLDLAAGLDDRQKERLVLDVAAVLVAVSDGGMRSALRQALS